MSGQASVAVRPEVVNTNVNGAQVPPEMLRWKLRWKTAPGGSRAMRHAAGATHLDNALDGLLHEENRNEHPEELPGEARELGDVLA